MGPPTPVTPPDKRVQVKIEVGHQAISKENPTSLFTHDWTTFVRGAEGAEIYHFVEKVVFHLHESFTKPRRVCKDPPFKVSEQGYGSFTLPIEIYFRNKEEPRKYSVNYELTLQLRGLPPLNCTKVEALTFLNPSDEFEKKLLSGGAVVLTPGISSDGQKSKQDKVASPASSHGSPSSQKRTSSTLTPKVKKESQLNHSKRPSVTDDVGSKPKKKKTDKHEHANNTNTSSNSLLKEISILTPGNEIDSKAKSLNTVKKVKEERARRNSTDENTPRPKESKHNGKESRIKKDKKRVSPSGGSELGIPKIKFTLKRQDESWSATPAQNNTENVTGQTLTTTSSTVLSNVTTATQQNDHVNKVMAEFAKQGDTSDDDTASPNHNNVSKIIQQRITPDELFSSSMSSIDNTRGGGNAPKKKSRVQKSHTSSNKTKGNKDFDKKSRSAVLSPQELTDLFKKLNELQDSDILQGVVDIVETSGQFEITPSTFDFDLCTLEAETISAIKRFLDNP